MKKKRPVRGRGLSGAEACPGQMSARSRCLPGPAGQAKKIFLNNVTNLKDLYIDEMNKNGKLNGSYFKDSFLGDDLTFCYEVTKSLQLIIMESLGE